MGDFSSKSDILELTVLDRIENALNSGLLKSDNSDFALLKANKDSRLDSEDGLISEDFKPSSFRTGLSLAYSTVSSAE